MGHDVYRNVKKYAPDHLTHREKLAAMVLADDASEDTWITWHSPYDPDLMAECLIKTDREMRRVLGVLQEAKVIEKVEGGHNGKVIKFRFLVLGPAVGGRNPPPYSETDATEKSPPTDGVGGRNPPRRRAENAPPTPHTPQPPTPQQSRESHEEQPPGGEGGGIATQQEQDARAALARIVSRFPKLALGEPELDQLAPLVVPWLERVPAAQLEQALIAGLPAEIGNPAGLIRTRLKNKLPPPARADPGEPRCTKPNCDPVTHLLTQPDGDMDYCPTCHPIGRTRARGQNGARL
jgi:hypothetical protein